ncbi:MAG: transketolase family protein [Clostridia bacterium]|nr:transketolase family protein [Clostridia bacterium]
MPKSIRDAYGEALRKYGVPNKNVIVLDADLSGSTKSALFGKEAPDRFFNVGISENNMVAMAAGMSTCGKNVFVNTFTSFLTTIGACAAKALISYGRLNVKMAGAYAGLSGAYDGPSHHALEDIAIMRAMPNFTVLVASDEIMVDKLTKYLVEDHVGPAYLRLSREAFPVVYSEDETFLPGGSKVLCEGGDAVVFTMGFMVSKSLEAAKRLKDEGINVTVVDLYSIKPIDRDTIVKYAKSTGAVVAAEEHNIIGGLTAAVSEVMLTEGAFAPLESVSMPDRHAETGKYSDLTEKFGFTADAVYNAVKKAISRKGK